MILPSTMTFRREARMGRFWGRAIGIQRSRTKRVITVFRRPDGFDLVDEDFSCRSLLVDPDIAIDELRQRIASVYGLTDVALEFPYLGIYASTQYRSHQDGRWDVRLRRSNFRYTST